MTMLMAIIERYDVSTLLDKPGANGLRAIKISTGGEFRRTGNRTPLLGVDDSQIAL